MCLAQPTGEQRTRVVAMSGGGGGAVRGVLGAFLGTEQAGNTLRPFWGFLNFHNSEACPPILDKDLIQPSSGLESALFPG